MLLGRSWRQNKLRTNYEPGPYQVTERETATLWYARMRKMLPRCVARDTRDPVQRGPEPVANEEVARDEMTIHDDSSTEDAQLRLLLSNCQWAVRELTDTGLRPDGR